MTWGKGGCTAPTRGRSSRRRQPRLSRLSASSSSSRGNPTTPYRCPAAALRTFSSRSGCLRIVFLHFEPSSETRELILLRSYPAAALCWGRHTPHPASPAVPWLVTSRALPPPNRFSGPSDPRAPARERAQGRPLQQAAVVGDSLPGAGRGARQEASRWRCPFSCLLAPLRGLPPRQSPGRRARALRGHRPEGPSRGRVHRPGARADERAATLRGEQLCPLLRVPHQGTAPLSLAPRFCVPCRCRSTRRVSLGRGLGSGLGPGRRGLGHWVATPGTPGWRSTLLWSGRSGGASAGALGRHPRGLRRDVHPRADALSLSRAGGVLAAFRFRLRVSQRAPRRLASPQAGLRAARGPRLGRCGGRGEGGRGVRT